MRVLVFIVVILWVAGSAQAGGTHGNLTYEASSVALRTGGIGTDSRMLFAKITNDSSFTDTIVAGYFCGDVHPDPAKNIEFRHWKMGLYDADTNLITCTAEQDGPYLPNTGAHWQGALFGAATPLASGDSVWAMVWADTVGNGTSDGGDVRINSSGTGHAFYYDYSYTANGGVCPDPATASGTATTWDLSIFLVGRSNGKITIYQADIGVGGDVRAENQATTQNKNFGGDEEIWVQDYFLFANHVIDHAFIEGPDMASWLPDSVSIDSSDITLYCFINTQDSDSIGVYQIMKPAVEGVGDGARGGTAYDTNGVTWNDWDATALEWQTAGAGAGSTPGTENTGDGSGDDRDLASVGISAVTAVGDVTWGIDTALVNGWYRGDFDYHWTVFDDLEDDDSRNRFYSSEQDGNNASVLPRWYIEYSSTLAAAATSAAQVITIQ